MLKKICAFLLRYRLIFKVAPKIPVEQECILAECVLTAAVAATRCHYWGSPVEDPLSRQTPPLWTDRQL